MAPPNVQKFENQPAGSCSAEEALGWISSIGPDDIKPGVAYNLTPEFSSRYRITALEGRLFSGSIYPKNGVDKDGKPTNAPGSNYPYPETDFKFTDGVTSANLIDKIKSLDKVSKDGNPLTHVMVVQGRHGEGWHQATLDHWPSDYELRFFSITERGAEDTINVTEQYHDIGLPLPNSVRSSSLRRCFQTSCQVMGATARRQESDPALKARGSLGPIIVTDVWREALEGFSSGWRSTVRHLNNYLIRHNGFYRGVGPKALGKDGSCDKDDKYNDAFHQDLKVILDKTGLGPDNDSARLEILGNVTETPESTALRIAAGHELLANDPACTDGAVFFIIHHHGSAMHSLHQLGVADNDQKLWPSQLKPVLLQIETLPEPANMTYDNIPVPADATARFQNRQL